VGPGIGLDDQEEFRYHQVSSRYVQPLRVRYMDCAIQAALYESYSNIFTQMRQYMPRYLVKRLQPAKHNQTQKYTPQYRTDNFKVICKSNPNFN